MQKRLVRKLDLEMLLSKIPQHPSPKATLEQYTIPADVAATMLYIAAYMHNGIVGKTVLDMGCGTGRLAIGAAFLGARFVVGVDIDKEAVKVASESAIRLNLKRKVQWVAADIDTIRGKFDTVLQNPPFGVQKRKADRKFLEKALETGKKVYSLHKSPIKDNALIKKIQASSSGFAVTNPLSFIKKFVEYNGGKIEAAYSIVMTIPHMFPFHTKRRHSFLADLYVIEGC
ncbi:MAG: METTL5 family protein [Candidatus Bathyarchaeales archaeon]